MPYAVPDPVCSATGVTGDVADNLEAGCGDADYTDCQCSCTLGGQPCTYEHCSGLVADDG